MKPRIRSVASTSLLAAFVAFAGCSKDDDTKADDEPAKAETTTETAQPSAVESTTTTTNGESRLAGAGGDYDIDPVHTQVVFRVDHFGVSRQFGRFNKTTGSVTLDENDPAASSVTLEIATASVFTADKKRDTHLRSPDFFDAKQFPVITFRSTAVAPRGDNMYDVTGTLDMHGVTKTITIPLEHVGSAEDPWGGFRSGFYATFSLQRSDYGMSHMLGGVGDEIQLMVTIEATRK